jgi:signal transduction histidine kinase
MSALRLSTLSGWPLKLQIRLLAVCAIATVLVCVALAVALVRQGESARAADAMAHLDRATNQMATQYDYLRRSFEERGAEPPLGTGDDGLLQSLTAVALGGLPGVEGGFYRADGGRVLGYAYPTYRGSGPKTDIPAAERPTIERVAVRAVQERRPADERIVAGPDLILFRALPLAAQGAPAGAVWVMERLAGLRTPRGQLYQAGLIAVLLISCGVAATAWWFTHRLERGVTGIEAGLVSMEQRLETPVPPTGIPELDRVGTGINRLASTVQEHQRERAELEARMHRMDRLAAVGRLVAGVAHEVRNPLASIRLKLHLAQQPAATTEGVTAAFTVIQQEVERLDRLVERLLTLAKPGDGTGEAIDLVRLVGDRVALWEGRAGAQKTSVEMRAPSTGLKAVVADGDRVAQILDNLIANAIDATQAQDGGRITVAVEQPSPHQILVTVEDTGPGVSPDLVARLVEPFFTTHARGTGLGLFLSAELARAMGGEVRYRPQAAGGACFELSLPC